MESTMRQYINLIETYSSPNEEHNKILNENYIYKNTDVLHPARLQVLAGIVEREADYYENLLESADKQLDTLTESERKQFDTLVEEHVYKIILEEALNEAVDIKAVLQKWGETAKKAVALTVLPMMKRVAGALVYGSLGENVSNVARLIKMAVDKSSVWFYNLVMNWVLAPFAKLVKQYVLPGVVAVIGGSLVYFNLKQKATTTGIEPVDAGIEKTLDAAEDIVTDLAQDIEPGIGLQSNMDNLVQSSENILNTGINQINKLTPKRDIDFRFGFGDKFDTATDKGFEKMGDAVKDTFNGGPEDIKNIVDQVVDGELIENLTNVTKQMPYEEAAEQFSSMGLDWLAKITEFGGNLTYDMIIPGWNSIEPVVNSMGVKGLAILGLIWFIYGGYRTAYLGGIKALFNRNRGADIAIGVIKQKQKIMQDELSQAQAEIEKLKADSNDTQDGDQAPPGAQQPTNLRPQVS